MHGDHYLKSSTESDWKLAFLRRNALQNAIVGLAVVLLSLLVNAPTWQFLAASAVMGALSYANWSYARLREHAEWLIPLMTLPCVSRLVGTVQLTSMLLFIMSLCFLVERTANRARDSEPA